MGRILSLGTAIALCFTAGGIASAQALSDSASDLFDIEQVDTAPAAAEQHGMKLCGGPGPCVDYYSSAFMALQYDWRKRPEMRPKIREAVLAERREEGAVDWWAASDRVYGKRNPIYRGPSALAAAKADAASASDRWYAECKTSVSKKGNTWTRCRGW